MCGEVWEGVFEVVLIYFDLGVYVVVFLGVYVFLDEVYVVVVFSYVDFVVDFYVVVGDVYFFVVD